MPVFDFVCNQCKTVFEKICSWDTAQECPACGSSDTTIQFPLPTVVRSGTLFDRKKIPTQFKEGVLDRIKSKYPTAKQYDRN
jgi:putative FmdB family regulatory protein